MANHQINADVLAVLLNVTSVKFVHEVNLEKKDNGTLTDSDPVGAMQFTVAVVLVYGVGVIGLLGITARRNRQMELMDKEVNKYIKGLHRDKPVKRKNKRKPYVQKLVSLLHSPDNKTLDTANEVKGGADDKQAKVLRESLSWTAGVKPKTRSTRTRNNNKSRRQREATKQILNKIAESQLELEEVLSSGNESSSHCLALCSPSLFQRSGSLPTEYAYDGGGGDVSTMSIPKIVISPNDDFSLHEEDGEEDLIEVTLVTPRHDQQFPGVVCHSEHGGGGRETMASFGDGCPSLSLLILSDVGDDVKTEDVQVHDGADDGGDSCVEVVVVPSGGSGSSSSGESKQDSDVHKGGVLRV